ncbi:MAG: penicillin-binding transpeptidase domain-containing protein [Oscillospiraceae bacterium]|nr:penicillin-binding transpeptidase domain-containing protein [Oscillospiraceae bacterium]
MIKNKKINFIRYFLIAAVFIVVMFAYGGTLLNMQIANAGQYQTAVNEITRTERFIIPAVRGEIFDRNGKPLVTNQLVYNLTIDGAKFPKTGGANPLAQTEYIIDLVKLINFHKDETAISSLPVISIGNSGYSYSMALSESQSVRDNFYRFLRTHEIPQHVSADELVTRLAARYNLDELMPPEERSRELFMIVLGICYDLDRYKIISNQTRYTLSYNICENLIKAVSENAHNYPGAEIIAEYRRIYHVPHAAPHLIGRIGRIPPEQLEKYTELGYPMDAVVGLNGIEAAFEEYLRGLEGLRIREYDRDGNIVGEKYETEPKAGKNVYLTIDIDLQQVAEHSLEKTIQRIHGLALERDDPEVNGADASAGAAAVIDPNTGEVLALATYPSYNLSTFSEDFAELRTREDSPFLNRALQGLYAPGSVFKIVTSAAALGSGNLTTGERIYDQGIFTRHENYQPACWRYHLNGGSCGTISVDQALAVSCNYFYFVIGERMEANRDIEILNSYARSLGLGVRTGVGVGEYAGTLASRANKEANASTWYPGDTLQAAIGQSDYLFTPIQLSTMLGTVLNGGVRYESRLLLYVQEYGSDEIFYAPKSEIVSQIEITPEHLRALKTGMRNGFSEGGTASILFNGLPGLTAGGKTGTAQVHREKSPNATIVAFAPYETPELAMSVVIENGRHGTWAGFTAEDVFAYYFGYKSFDQSMDLPDEPDEPDNPEDLTESRQDDT